MAGHSKWNNIKNRKGAQDAKRGKVFQKLSREIYMAAKSGGSDSSSNPALRLALDKARAENMPNDNIQREIKKATNAGEGENYDEVVYEGYGPSGVALLVHTLTDNLNRTSTNVRVAFHKNSGSLGESGSVAYMFDRKGYFVIEREGLDVNEDTMTLSVLEAGGDDIEVSDEEFEIYTDSSEFTVVRDELEKEYTLSKAELTMVPQIRVELSNRDKEILEKIIEALEDDDDVSEVYTSADM